VADYRFGRVRHSDAGAAVLKRTLEDVWREISPYLDYALGLDSGVRERWLDDLQTIRPAVAAQVRSYLAEMTELEAQNFLEEDVRSTLGLKRS
jgi:hypothetical protein